MSDYTNTATNRRFALPKIKGSAIVMSLYLLFLLLPIYWLLNMS
jgi:glycerol transport system permease protein